MLFGEKVPVPDHRSEVAPETVAPSVKVAPGQIGLLLVVAEITGVAQGV